MEAIFFLNNQISKTKRMRINKKNENDENEKMTKFIANEKKIYLNKMIHTIRNS